MNRPIKFRAWDPSEKKMLWRGLFDKNWYYTPTNDIEGCHTAREISQSDEFVLNVMLFIGLLDKNGKEIYEGDIVEFESEIGTEWRSVLWEDAVSAFTLRNDMDADQLGAIGNDVLSVIGNIYENPELLKVETQN